MLTGFTLTYEAKVHIVCKPVGGGMYFLEYGTRTLSKHIQLEGNFFLAYDVFRAGLLEIPNITTLLDAAGAILADTISSNLPTLVWLAPKDQSTVCDAVISNKPTSPTAGKWKGKSPCD